MGWLKLLTKDDKQVDDSNPLAVAFQGGRGATQGSPLYTGRPTSANTLTIPSGGTTTSGNVDLGDKPLVALLIPASWDGGNLTITASDTAGGTYGPVYDSTGSQITITVGGAARVVALVGTQLQAMASLRYVKLVAASAVAADRSVVVISKG